MTPGTTLRTGTTPPAQDRKAPRTMGTSRDFTTGNPTGATTVLERAGTSGGGRPVRSRVDAPERPRRTASPDREVPATGRPGRRKRLGSKQVVSVRGRRTAPVKSASKLTRISLLAVAMFSVGVAIAMWLSGVSTQQTFRIQSLVAQESQLANQLETLNRDLANVSSTAELARRAGEMGMVVPDQPGILSVDGNGDTVEQRPADPAASPIIDVNGAPVRPGQASSDPNKTDELTENLEAVPAGETLPPAPAGPAPVPLNAPAPAVAPYAPDAGPAPAPAPAPAGEVPPAPLAPAPNIPAPAPVPEAATTN